MSRLLFFLWFLASLLVGYSYFSYQANEFAHSLFGSIFFIISSLGFLVDRLRLEKKWTKAMALFLKIGLILFAIITLSAEYSRLFGEYLPLFD